MEFVEGEDLSSLLKKIEKGEREHFSLGDIISIISQLFKVLDYAHQRKVIDGDVKPAIIMLRQDGQLALRDFGISKAKGDSDMFRFFIFIWALIDMGS